jgi:hypothetical protein
VAAALGVAVLATTWEARTNSLTAGLGSAGEIASARLDGFHAAFFVGAVLVFLAAMSALLIHDEDAAASMGRTAPEPEAALEAV